MGQQQAVPPANPPLPKERAKTELRSPERSEPDIFQSPGRSFFFPDLPLTDDSANRRAATSVRDGRSNAMAKLLVNDAETCRWSACTLRTAAIISKTRSECRHITPAVPLLTDLLGSLNEWT